MWCSVEQCAVLRCSMVCGVCGPGDISPHSIEQCGHHRDQVVARGLELPGNTPATWQRVQGHK